MVTGGNGFIGMYVLRELVQMGEIPVSYDIQPPSCEMGDLLGSVRFIQGNILNATEVFRVVKEYKIERIIHLVSLLTAASQEDPVNAYYTNVGGTLNVLEAARVMGVQRIAYASSLAVYGLTDADPVAEDARKEPVSLYGATKLFCEHLGVTYRERFGIDFIAVRWPVVWGPGQREKQGKSGVHGAGKFTDIIEKPARGETVTVRGGSQKYELIYVMDAAHSIVSAAFASGLRHAFYNVGSESMVSLYELVEMITRYIPQASIRVEEGYDYAVPCRGPLDISRAKKELGFQPRFKPVQAVEHYMRHLGIVRQ